MQPSSLPCRVVLSRPACRVVRAAADVRAVSLVRRPHGVARVARAVSDAAPVTVGHRRIAAVAGFGTRRVRGASASVLRFPASPNPAFEPTAASGVGSI